MKHKKNHVIKPHLHLKRLNKIFYTSETIVLLKGKLRVDFYDNKISPKETTKIRRDYDDTN